jgi:photosystem II stability/assembly factor-like uncharacterized protein
MEYKLALLFSLFLLFPLNISGECGREFGGIKGPFAFGGDYISEDGIRWSAGGSGSVSRASRNGMATVFTVGFDVNLVSIFFYNQFGYAAGSLGEVFATTDMGQSWTRQKARTRASIEAISCVDPITCLAVGQYGTILKTTNGGNDWDLHSLRIGETLTAVEFVDHLNAWITGKNGLVMKTVDGGISWKIVKNAMFDSHIGSKQNAVVWLGANFRDVNHGCLGGYNRIACTSDAGKTWNRTIIDEKQELNNFVNFVFGDGAIRVLEECARDLVSSNLGKTWQRVQ